MRMERAFLASRLVSFSVLLGALPGGLLACGAKVQPASPAAPPAVVSPVPVAKEEAPELSPVEAPPELFALARFKRPQTALETVAAWANFPFKLHDVLPAELRSLEGVVAWDAPLEAVSALDPLGEGKVPEPLAVFSVGLTSLEGALDFARSKGQSVRRLRAGVYRLGDWEDISCAVGVAVGSAPARLVCGHRTRDVEGLFNYATRGLPNEPLPNLDFQIELRLQPIKKQYEAELGSARLLAGFLLRSVELDSPRFDRAMSDVTYALVDEATALVNDLDTLRIDSNLDREKNLVDLRFDIKFSGQKSWLVQANSEIQTMMEPAPELFWQMPADSTAASFGVGWKPGRLKPIGRTLADLVDGYLEFEKAPARLRAEASKSIERLFDQNTKQVQAQGELPDVPTDPALASGYRVFGWQVAAIDGDSKPWLSLFDGLTTTLASRDLERILKQRHLDIALLPKFSTHGVQLKGYRPGAKAYRVEIPRQLFEKYLKLKSLPIPTAKGATPAQRVPLSLVVAFDGQHCWLGMSTDEKALLKRLESLKDPKLPVLRTRAGLEALKNTPRAAGGFLTLGRFAGQLTALGASDSDASKVISVLPHHGETPLLFSYDVHASGPELTTTFTVPRAGVEDLGALLPVIALMGRK